MCLFDLDFGVIVACDVSTMESYTSIVKETSSIEGIVGFKVGVTLALPYGLKRLTDVVKEHCDLPVIYDHQKAGTDIPRMGEKFSDVCYSGGVRGVILFPQAGPKTEEAFISAVFKKHMVPLVGGEMTHPGYLVNENGYIRNDAPRDMYTLAVKKGVKYLILPGNKPGVLRRYQEIISCLEKDIRYCMPGIGHQGGDISSSFKALSGSPAYAIIGSSIYSQSNMSEAAKMFCKEALRFG
jgi:orotidine-5'-phosphate decarboxylase